MVISVPQLVSVLVLYVAMAGSGLYWLWRRVLSQQARTKWAVAVVVMPVPALIALGVVRPGWRQPYH
jgi:hypothetical protein